MKAIILGAGRAGFVDSPISNLEIYGERLLDLQVSCLRQAGADNIMLVVGYRAEEVQRADIKIRLNPSWDAGGSLSSLGIFRDVFDGADDVLVLYGDTLFEPWVIEALSRTQEGIAIACLLDRSNSDIGRYREYAYLEAGALVAVSSSDVTHSVRTVFTGLVLVRRGRAEVVRGYIDEGAAETQYHVGRLLDRMLHHGLSIAPVIIEHGWAELSTARFYENALSKSVFVDRVIQIHTDWTARAQRYDRLDWVNNDRLLSAMVGIALEGNPRSVLDLGTGSGKVLTALRHAIGAGEFWGIDTSQAMLDRIPDREGLILRLCNAENLEQLTQSYFDLVTARMVFHHIGNVRSAMEGIARVLRPGGRLVVCEGVPPTTRVIRWYTEMFRYKEDRHTLTETDMIDMFVKSGFKDISTRTVVLRRASLNNWLENSGIPRANIDMVKSFHYQAPPEVVEDYDMQFIDGDCLMTWRFAVVVGIAPG
jgi:ubiquinone/menaquinone biosynthesis C-methylase UbiE/choline kinase